MTSKRLPNVKTLIAKAREFCRGRDDILDVILFGSTARGKSEPGDIDLLVLFKDKVDLDALQRLRRMAPANTHVIGKTWASLLDPSFNAREAILTEGRSLLRNESIAEGFGLEPLSMFQYDISNIGKSDRMRFYYALHGRGGTGVLQSLTAWRLTDNTLLCPINGTDEMRQFLTSWHMTFTEIPLLIPGRIKGMLR